ncbi:hypothetical protein DSO57_1032301 [Entomophthora muscae]|uniref:Uncharacterized protein n=1 Tax=Entomophthora muscae TaxID=34485 RepID=A0ACC2S2J4_9FUNG|nr:hypothetical protein DSO57_1032301 [Entomophthora muscae]
MAPRHAFKHIHRSQIHMSRFILYLLASFVFADLERVPSYASGLSCQGECKIPTIVNDVPAEIIPSRLRKPSNPTTSS